jgi:peptidase M28-like protein/type IX secretion system substrate protein
MKMKNNLLIVVLAIFFGITSLNAQHVSRNDSLINEAMQLINSDSVEYQLQWLQDMGTRFLMAPNHKEVAEMIKARFESFGITEVRLDSFQCYTNINYSILQYDTTTWQYNVEAKIIGTEYPDEEFLIMGHHDNVQIDSDPEVFTPGADDNASGTVAALETARVLMEMGYQPERTIIFLTTAAEELMNFGDAGSRHYAAAASAAGRNIWGVINNDMIAYNNGTDVITLSNVIGSEEITGVAELITDAYTTLSPQVQSSQPQSGADLQPFIEAGYHGVYLMERVFNPYYHTVQDLVEFCDIDYLTEVIKISCGTLLHSDVSVGIAESSVKEICFTAYPNPFADNINMVLNDSDYPCEINVSNITGQVIKTTITEPHQKKVMLDLHACTPGVYIVTITNNGNIGKLKIVKQ